MKNRIAKVLGVLAVVALVAGLIPANAVLAAGKGQGVTNGAKNLLPHVIIHYTHNGKDHPGGGPNGGGDDGVDDTVNHSTHFSLLPGKWADVSAPIAYVVDGSFAPDGAVAAIDASFASWDTEAAIDFAVTVALSTIDANAELTGPTGQNTVTFRLLAGLPDALAVTILWFNNDDGDGTWNGEPIEEADIFFNTKFKWAIAEDGARGKWYDIQDVATHEAGHVVGLGHTPFNDETMYFSAASKETKKRSLELGDIAGAVSLYGTE